LSASVSLITNVLTCSVKAMASAKPAIIIPSRRLITHFILLALPMSPATKRKIVKLTDHNITPEVVFEGDHFETEITKRVGKQRIFEECLY
jgi:hypothetical protein